jgi:hypothetical protein
MTLLTTTHWLTIDRCYWIVDEFPACHLRWSQRWGPITRHIVGHMPVVLITDAHLINQVCQRYSSCDSFSALLYRSPS